jgi:uncharacterized protein (TIGR02118 family)
MRCIVETHHFWEGTHPMHRLVVCYHQPENTSAFDKHYAEIHAPMAAKIPGLVSFTTGSCESIEGSEPPYYMVAELVFESKAALGAAMKSSEGQAAVADVPTFASGGTTMYSYEERVISPSH